MSDAAQLQALIDRYRQLHAALARRKEAAAQLLAVQLPSIPPMPSPEDPAHDEKLVKAMDAMSVHATYAAAVMHAQVTNTMLLLQVHIELLEAKGSGEGPH